MKTKPDLSFWKLWNLSFGFFGVQIAYALQSANISRIFATLGADPHDLSFFWILPPLMGIIVQPLVGKWSDNTWTRFGRRIPYLFIGALVAVLVMCMLPNAGSFGLTVGAAMIFGLISLMFLDTSINMAMQPFKMMVGDMVNEKQKGLAYSIQSFLCNAGSLMGYLFPIIFTTLGIASIAPEGEIPDSVKWSFYIGAIILILCVIYTTATVKEMPPKEYAEYHGITEEDDKEEKSNMLQLLIKAPKTFWTVGLVQFFCWAAFMYMWTYTTGAIAESTFNTPTTIKDGVLVLDVASKQYQTAGDWVGVLFAVQAIGSVLWAIVIPMFKNRKFIYSLSLVLGAIGFISTHYITDQYMLFASYALIGCAWAAMLALPFTILTNSLSGKNMGTYLGLFNGTICLPQIIAAALGGVCVSLLTPKGEIAAQGSMLVLAGILLIIGAISVFIIKETSAENSHTNANNIQQEANTEVLAGRHGCITTLLWLGIIENIIMLLIYTFSAFAGIGLYSSTPEPILIRITWFASSIFAIIALFMLLNRKKKGFFIMVILQILNMITTFIISDGQQVLFYLIAQIISPYILYAILNIRKNGVSYWSTLK